MARLGMVIDLQRCVGCGACAFACKAENNTRDRADGQAFNWADFVMRTEGTFPNVTHWVMPVLCNHCSDAPCVAACPVTPKAMFKTPDGITMHNDDSCIGCRRCQYACPYSVGTLGEDSFNGGWYAVPGRLNGPGTTPISGFPVYRKRNGREEAVAFRWYLTDPVSYDKSIDAKLEHGPTNDINANYRTAAFYYDAAP